MLTEELKTQLKKLNSRKLYYINIQCPNQNFSDLKIATSEDINADPKTKFTEEELKEMFENYTKSIKEDEYYFSLYDFRVNNRNVTMSVIIMLTLIPDKSDSPFDKVFYSRHSMEAGIEFKAQKAITINDKKDLNYENIQQIVKNFKHFY